MLILTYFLFPSCSFVITVRYCTHIAQDVLSDIILMLIMELLSDDSCPVTVNLFLKNFQISFEIFLFKHCFLTYFT